MLRIRSSQMRSLEPLAEKALHTVIFHYLREQSDPAFDDIDDDALRDIVRAGIERGRTYGLTWQSSLCAFVNLTVLVAPRFDLYPPARAVLTDSRVEPNERVIALVNTMTEDDWQRARAYV